MNPKLTYLKISDLKYAPHVYHSPQVPGWVAWASVLQLKNGDILVGFNQVTGALNRPEPELSGKMKCFPNGFYNMEGLDKRFKIIRAVDKGPWFSKWESYYEEECEGPWPPARFLLLQTRKGTLLRTTHQGIRVSPDFRAGALSRSTDNGRNWTPYTLVCDDKKWRVEVSRVIQLRDGRLLMATEGCKVGTPEKYGWAKYNWVSSYLLVSEDDGETWSEPVEAMISDGSAGYCEPAIAELSNGDILMMVRVESLMECNPLDAWNPENNPGRNRKQSILTKKGDRWILGRIEQLNIPHGGHPEFLKTREGLLLYVSGEGFWGSLEEGRDWTRIETLPHATYYPSSVQFDDERIFAVGHNGGDCPFPPPEDMAIWKTSFRLV